MCGFEFSESYTRLQYAGPLLVLPISDVLPCRGQHGSDADVRNAVGKAFEVEIETSPGGAVYSAAVVFNGNAS